MAPVAGKGRVKKVTDPLDDKVKSRLRGEGDKCCLSSSGSEHEGGELLPSFVGGLFFFFFFSDDEEDAGMTAAPAEGVEGDEDDAGSAGSDGEGDRGLPPVPLAAMVRDLLEPSAGEEDRFRRGLVADVTEAVERLAGLHSSDRPAFRRAVMSSLRESGYDAGVCKARWESCGGVTSGKYEYIDVVRPPPDSPATPPSREEQPQQRYLVDVDFAAEFDIARPTAEYAQVSAELPQVYVGRPEELRQLLRLLAVAARRSLRAKDMHVPPWRKGRYMQAKWLGPYRRSLNPVPSVATPPPPAPPPPTFSPRDVKCRCVGFDVVAAAARRVAPTTTTRA